MEFNGDHLEGLVYLPHAPMGLLPVLPDVAQLPLGLEGVLLVL